MSDWLRDAAVITALVVAFEVFTGRIGAAVKWCKSLLDERRERRKAEKEAEEAREKARQSKRALQETIRLKDMEIETKDRIIAAMSAEMERLHRNGGAP